MSIGFSSGDRVQVAGGSLSGPSTGGVFVVLRRYPVEYMEPVYRIRSEGDGCERVVPGTELRPHRDRATIWAKHFRAPLTSASS